MRPKQTVGGSEMQESECIAPKEPCGPIWLMSLAVAITSVFYSASYASDPIWRKTDQEDLVHKYFDGAIDYELPEEQANRVLVDGKLIPRRITIACTRDRTDLIAEAEPIVFVLVLPQTVKVDGLDLKVDRPFFVATTELTNAQYAQLVRGFVENGYRDYVEYELARANQDEGLNGKELVAISEYLADPQLPRLMVDLKTASEQTASLSLASRMAVRIPGLGEWFAAMRAGATSRYWWGNEVDPSLVAWRANASEEIHDLTFLRPNNEGPANQLGVFNILGNASELVYPTRSERSMLRSRFGPNAQHARAEVHRRPGFTVFEHTTFSLGGSVHTRPGVVWNSELGPRIEAYQAQAVEWAGIILETQEFEVTGWRQRGTYSGLRFVIDLPPGEIIILGAQNAERPSITKLEDQ